MAFNVNAHHPLYDLFLPSWKMMRDCVDGEEVVKDAGLQYLPMKTGMLAITDNVRRSAAYAAYQTRAEFPEIVAPTITGSRGLLHSMPATYEIPPALDYILETATLDGKTLESFHEDITTEILTTGRYGILPGVRKDGTFYMAGYTAEAIINWDETDGVLDYVVLDESKDTRDRNTNQWTKTPSFLELSLVDGAYVGRHWGGDLTTAGDDVIGLDARQKALDVLPFVFVNVGSVTPDPDDVPLYGLGKIAIRIYRMDADYTHGLHMTAEPTPWVSGYDNPKKAAEEGLIPTSIGASTIWILPKGAQAGFLEFTGPGLEAQAKAIATSLERAVLFGAQILSEENRAAESGESRKLRLRSQQSILKTINKNTCAALERALRNIAVWAGINPELVSIRPSQDLIDYSLSAQELTALVAGWQSGAYSKQTLFDNIQRAGMIPNERTFEEEQELIQDEPPALGTLAPPTDPNANAKPGDDPNADPNNQNNSDTNGGTGSNVK